MSDILDPTFRTLLAGFARANVLVAFDFDGTLAPIVDHPRDAMLRPETRALLREVCERYPCAVVSGRDRADVLPRLQDTGLENVVGNHGADMGSATGLGAAVQEWKNSINAELAGLDGVWTEDKGLSLAVHYRGTPHGGQVRERLRALALPGARVTDAKAGINVVGSVALDKGGALELLQRQAGCERVIFVGDDVTDEDVFSRDWNGALLGIRVGTSPSAAAFRLADQTQIDDLLQALVDLRSSASE